MPDWNISTQKDKSGLWNVVSVKDKSVLEAKRKEKKKRGGGGGEKRGKEKRKEKRSCCLNDFVNIKVIFTIKSQNRFYSIYIQTL